MDWNEIKLYIRVICNPLMWTRDEKVCPFWDKMVREMLKDSTVIYKDNSIKLNDYEIWIGNGPCFSGQSRYNRGIPNVTTGRRTALLLWDKAKKAKVTEPPAYYKDFKSTRTKLHKVLK